MTLRQIAFDTETTGIDPAAGHRIVEIGCVEMEDYIRTGRTFHAYVNPKRDMPPEAERVHGLSEAFLADKPVFAEVVEGFLAFIGDSVLVAHNASFDMKFLNYELRSIGYATIPMEKSLDTVMMARKKYPGQPASLDALCRRFNIDLSARTKHGALLDAELLAEVYLELMGGRQASFGLGANAAQIGEQEGDAPALATVTNFPLRHFAPSEDESAAHTAFISRAVKNAVWETLDES
jgi:DNA polymerase III subunit epsilon